MGGGGGATGGGGGSSCAPCPGSSCGFFDAGAGCAETFCGLCAAGTECGVSRANRCDVPQLCMQDGWCFENPLPQGNTIRGAWAAGPREVYLVGDNATALLWNGERHAVIALPALPDGVDLTAVHGTSSQNLFIVGSRGTILHFDGTTWSREFIAGGYGPNLRAVLVRTGGDIVAVGAGNNIQRRLADAGWIDELLTDGPIDLNDVAEGPDGLLYALGTYSLASPRAGLMRERDAGVPRTWDRTNRPPLINANSMWLSGDGGFYIAGLGDAGAGLGRAGFILKRAGDGGWDEVARVPDELRVLRGVPGDELFAAGENGLFVHVVDGGARLARLGGAWNALAPLPGGPLVEGRAGQVAQFSISDGGLTPLSAGTQLRINAVCGSSPSDLFAASEGTPGCTGATCAPLSLERTVSAGAVRWNEVPHLLPDSAAFTACGSFVGYRWLLGDGTPFLVNTGANWRTEDPRTSGLPPSRSTSIWVESGVSTWITNRPAPASTGSTHVTRLVGPPSGQTPRAVTYDGGGDLITVMAGALGRGVALGEKGLMFSVAADGGLEPAPRLGSDDFTAMADATLNDGGVLVIAAGLNGALYRQEGAAAFVSEGPLSADLQAVWVGPTGEAFVAGADIADGGRRISRVFHRVGSSWVAVPLRGDQAVRAVWAAPGDGGSIVWVGGPGGVILRRDP